MFVCLPVSQPASQPVGQSVSQSVSQTVNQTVSQTVSLLSVSPKKDPCGCFMLSRIYSVIVYSVPYGNAMPGKILAENPLLQVKLQYSLIWNISGRKGWINYDF